LEGPPYSLLRCAFAALINIQESDVMGKLTKAIAALLLVASSSGFAQMPTPKVEVIPAPAETDAIPLFGEATPGSASSENWSLFDDKHYVVRNVTRPTLTAFLPDPAKATGAAVVVAPGGAFMLLAIGPEGWEVGKRLADRGIAAFVLKYRVMPTPAGEAEASAFMNKTVQNSMTDPTKAPSLNTLLPPMMLLQHLLSFVKIQANMGSIQSGSE
jgi:hypothetical protein